MEATTTPTCARAIVAERGLTEIICPDGGRVKIEDCFKSCRIADQFPGKRCHPLPVLKNLFGKERKVRPFTYSTTELIGPTCQAFLKRSNPFAESAEDAYWRTWGTAAHHIFEGYAPNHLSEVRFQDPDDPDNAGGQLDLLDIFDGVLWDGKTTGAFKVRKLMAALERGNGWWSGEGTEWAIQVNRYRQKAERVGLEVRKMVIYAILRDWGFRERNDGIPKAVQFEVPRISDHWLDLFFRIKAHRLNIAHLSGECDPCPMRVLWNGNRCRGYCPVSEVCREMCATRGIEHPVFGWPAVEDEAING